uniref:Uncharacterized protein n=1 Tax=Salix viminalis TaxID=40686 RepID=A0A6N2N6J1_SALVM
MDATSSNVPPLYFLGNSESQKIIRSLTSFSLTVRIIIIPVLVKEGKRKNGFQSWQCKCISLTPFFSSFFKILVKILNKEILKEEEKNKKKAVGVVCASLAS